MVGKAEHLAKGTNPRFVVTSLSAERDRAAPLYENVYCARGEMENRIKEQQLCLTTDEWQSKRVAGSAMDAGLGGILKHARWPWHGHAVCVVDRWQGFDTRIESSTRGSVRIRSYWVGKRPGREVIEGCAMLASLSRKGATGPVFKGGPPMDTNNPSAPEAEMRRLLSFLGKHGASDLHLKVGYPPYVRIGGYLRALQLPPVLDTSHVTQMVQPLVPSNRWIDFETKGSLDFSAADESGDRYRINIFRSMGEVHVAVRRVQSKILDFNELNLPEVYRELISTTMDGLILVCGVTGSGKSSTLAAMIEYINQNSQHAHHHDRRPDRISISRQEEHYFSARSGDGRAQLPGCAAGGCATGPGRDLDRGNAGPRNGTGGDPSGGDRTFGDGIAALRRRAAQLRPDARVLSTGRSTPSFARRWPIACGRSCASGLIPGIDEGVRYPSTEVLIANSIVKDKILHEEDEDLPGVLHQCREEGMRDYTHSLVELVKSDKVLREVAMDNAPHREALMSALKGIDSGGAGIITRLRS